MITPGLWRRALKAGAQWRLLCVWAAGVALPALALLAPLALVLARALSWSPRAHALAQSLDGEAMVDLLHVIGMPENAATLRAGGLPALVLLFLCAPFLAGAGVAVARAAEPLSFRELLRGAGENYGRMLRLAVVSIIPLGVAFGIGAGGFNGARRRALRSVTEAAALHGTYVAAGLALVVIFVAHVTLDLARGVMAAQPDRRSALFAWGHAVRVLLRRPLQIFGMGLIATLAAVAVAALMLLIRLRISQGSSGGVLVALLFGELAVAAIGWGRASRIIGFAELVRADEAERARLKRPLVVAPPAPPAPAPVEAAPLPPAPAPELPPST